MTVEAYAKVNLTLEVYGKRSDGYHALRSVVQPITLADTLEIEPTDDGTISSDTGYGEKDLIVKAGKRLADFAHATGMSRPLCSHATGMSRPLWGCRVHVLKRIPAGGGLGGGSADAAAVLLALNELWRLGLTPEQLAEIGASVGSDVPALVLAQHYRCPVLMEGRGEKVSLIKGDATFLSREKERAHLVLANPGVHSSTPEVFARCTPRVKGDATFLSRENKCPPLFFNDLQPAAIALHPEIAAALSALREIGAEDVMMSGSGATVFGFAKDADAAEAMSAAMRTRGYSAWSCRMLMR